MKTQASLIITLVLASAGCRTGTDPVSNTKSVDDMASDTWCHAPRLRSTDDVSLSFDYQVTLHSLVGNDRENRADTAWLNVSKASFTGHEAVNVIITSESISTKYLYGDNLNNANYVSQKGATPPIPLSWDAPNQKFTASIPGGISIGSLTVGDDQSFPRILKFSIQVDGQWQSDPVNGTHNFRFFPYQDTKGACTGNHWSPGNGF